MAIIITDKDLDLKSLSINDGTVSVRIDPDDTNAINLSSKGLIVKAPLEFKKDHVTVPPAQVQNLIFRYVKNSNDVMMICTGFMYENQWYGDRSGEGPFIDPVRNITLTKGKSFDDYRIHITKNGSNLTFRFFNAPKIDGIQYAEEGEGLGDTWQTSIVTESGKDGTFNYTFPVSGEELRTGRLYIQQGDAIKYREFTEQDFAEGSRVVDGVEWVRPNSFDEFGFQDYKPS